MALAPPLKPMLAKLERELPRDGYLYEPKWDGFRCLAFRHGDDVDLRSRHDPECRGAPPWLSTHDWRGQRFCVVDDVDSLLWVANLCTIEFHPFLHRVDAHRPDYVVFDLDPGAGASIVECCDVALALRERVDGVAKTSGAAGLHVYARAGDRTYAETKAYARELAAELADTRDDVVAAQSRRERAGRVLVDWLQNDETRSTVAPYSLRGVAYPTVSMPVTWDEVERCARERRPELLVFLAADVSPRIARYGDLFGALRPREV